MMRETNEIKEDQKIWRYMDFAKFISMLENESLHLCRTDIFEDTSEGRYSHANIQDIEEQVKNINSEFGKNLDIDHVMRMFSHNSDSYSSQIRKCTYVNCWHINEYESAAMWDLYLGKGDGVAIQSTYERLLKVCNNNNSGMVIRPVEYIDFHKDIVPIGNIMNPFFYKRLEFAHERELRLVQMNLPIDGEEIDFKNVSNQRVIEHKVNLKELIENIYVSPRSGEWLSTLVNKIVKRYNLDNRVIRSELYKKFD